MNVKARTIYFYSTIAVFIVLAPICVLFSLGYRLDWKDRRLVQTGSLIISTIPRETSARIDDIGDCKKNPSNFSAILPGNYKIRLEKDGFFPWIAEIQIRPKRSTIIENAVLFPSTKKAAQLLDRKSGPLAVDPSGKHFAFSDSTGRVVNFQNTNDRTIDFSIPISGTALDSIGWSTDGRRLLLTRKRPDGATELSTLEFNRNASERRLESQTPLTGAWWGAEGNDFLFTADDTGLHRFDIFTGKSDLFFSGKVIDFLPLGMGGYLIEKTSQGARLSWDNPTRQAAEVITTLAGTELKFWPGVSGWFAIEDKSAGQCSLFRRNGGGSVDRLSLPENCTFVKFHTSGLYALTGDGFELRLVSLDTGERTTLLRQSTAYRNVEWYPKGRVVLLANTDKIEAIDLAIPSIVRTVLTETPGPRILTVDPDGSALIFDTRDGEAHQLKRIALQ